MSERVRALIEPALAERGVEVVDVEHHTNVLRVVVDGRDTLDLDTISDVSRQVSEALDHHDVVPGRYVLEVSSPGIERRLRTPEHFRRFVGHTVAVKTRPGVDGDRRVEGRLETADEERIVVAGRALAYADIERARTTVDWGAELKKNTKKAATGKKAARV